jgi:KaiC/GvpD/RAD55 family RecA-like ATPase
MTADLKIGKVNVTQTLRKVYAGLKTGWISLLKTPAENHLPINVASLDILIKELNYTCIYITLGKSCTELETLYKKQGIDTKKIHFIDAISKMYGVDTADTNTCTYVSGPLDIDAISVAISNRMADIGEGKVCVFLDSVSTVLLYNSMQRTLRFSKFLTETLKSLGAGGVMVSIAKGKSTDLLVKELSKLCDQVIEIPEK